MVKREVITELSGNSGSGKTQFALFELVREFKESPSKFNFLIDTNNSMQPARLAAFCDHFEVNLESFMSKLQYARVFSREDMKRIFLALE